MKGLASALALFQGSTIISTGSRVLKAKLGAVFLGPEGVAILAQLGSFSSLLTTGSGLGMSNGLIRRVAECRRDEEWDRLREQLTTVQLTLLGTSVFLVLLSAGFSQHISSWLLDDGGKHAGLVAIALISVPLSLFAMQSRGVLNGLQLPRDLVAAELTAEILSLAAFAVLVFVIGLPGACVALVVWQLLRFLLLQRKVRRALGDRLAPFAVKQFRVRELRHNLHFGVVGLLLVSLGIFTTITVTRWVIEQEGLDVGGIFSVAWKVSAIYLGALYAATSNFLFPGLVASLKNGSSSEKLNSALALYAYIIPPMILAILVGGETLVALLFSAEFTPAAGLLLLLLPADMLRVSAETTGLSMLARANLLPYAVLYVLWASTFLLLSSVWLPTYGLQGVGYAYVGSQLINLIGALMLGMRFGKVQWSRGTTLALGRALLLVFGAAWLLSSGLGVLVQCIALLFLISAWVWATQKDAPFRQLVSEIRRAKMA